MNEKSWLYTTIGIGRCFGSAISHTKKKKEEEDPVLGVFVSGTSSSFRSPFLIWALPYSANTVTSYSYIARPRTIRSMDGFAA